MIFLFDSNFSCFLSDWLPLGLVDFDYEIEYCFVFTCFPLFSDKARSPSGRITKEERSEPLPESLKSVLIGML
jgi:hypothetical protein